MGYDTYTYVFSIAGGTRAALMNHFAVNNNISDLATKEGMQETTVSILGLCIGLYISALINSSQYQLQLSWLIFIILTIIHIIANINAMRGLVFRTLNKQRALILITHYMRYNNILSPQQVAQSESVFGMYSDPYRLGCKLQRNQLAIDECNKLIQCHTYYCHQLPSNQYNIYYSDQCKSTDILYSLYDAISIHVNNQLCTPRQYKQFISDASTSGWLFDDNSVQLNADIYRYSIVHDKFS